ncbi:MAG: hypothetical protein LBQ74_13885 [Prevotella sp.]|jgi:hypothetical protein|nr:hypothetical protein [Prevotella sp.]
MNISFKIETISYIVAEFKSNKINIKIGHSGLYEDKFQELLNVFYNIYIALKGETSIYFPFVSEIVWKDDFVHYKWTVSMDSLESNINIKITELYPANPEYHKILLDENFSKKQLYDDIYISLHQLYNDFGFIGYKHNWDIGNFPIGEYLLLKSDKYNANLSLKLRLEDDQWKNKVNKNDELNTLSFEEE